MFLEGIICKVINSYVTNCSIRFTRDGNEHLNTGLLLGHNDQRSTTNFYIVSRILVMKS